MREILFRAKRKNWRELPKEEWWVEGYYCYFMSEHCILPKNLNTDAALVGEQKVFIVIDPGTLCQYTGLKDKDGNRIWENDIVEDKRFNGFYKIVFRVRDGGWYVENIKSGALFRIMERTSYQYERCGNIFDNPELLKGDQSCTDL